MLMLPEAWWIRPQTWCLKSGGGLSLLLGLLLLLLLMLLRGLTQMIGCWVSLATCSNSSVLVANVTLRWWVKWTRNRLILRFSLAKSVWDALKSSCIMRYTVRIIDWLRKVIRGAASLMHIVNITSVCFGLMRLSHWRIVIIYTRCSWWGTQWDSLQFLTSRWGTSCRISHGFSRDSVWFLYDEGAPRRLLCLVLRLFIRLRKRSFHIFQIYISLLWKLNSDNCQI